MNLHSARDATRRASPWGAAMLFSGWLLLKLGQHETVQALALATSDSIPSGHPQ